VVSFSRYFSILVCVVVERVCFVKVCFTKYSSRYFKLVFFCTVGIFLKVSLVDFLRCANLEINKRAYKLFLVVMNMRLRCKVRRWNFF